MDLGCRITRAKGFPEPALLATCKSIRREAIAVYYDNNFHSVDSNAIELFESKRRALLESHNIRLTCFNIIPLVDDPMDWSDVMQWMKLWYDMQGVSLLFIQGQAIFDEHQININEPVAQETFIYGMIRTVVTSARAKEP